jgi:glucose/arabinose dehydrogenase
VPDSLKIEALATGLQHPRSLYILPNGDVLVAESKAPTAAAIKRPKEIVMGFIESWATSGGDTGESNRITLLHDSSGDGVPDTPSIFLDHLNSPFGVALVGNDLYIANTDAIVKYPYHDGDTRITAPGETLTPLPGGPIDHHWTKSLTASPGGKLLYVGVGSNSNITENGMEAEKNRADILEVDRATGRYRIFASGLRNPNGLTFEPHRQRARRNRARFGARLYDLGEGRRVLRLAPQLLRPARIRPNGRISSPRPFRRTTPRVRTWRRSGSPSTPAPIFPSAMRRRIRRRARELETGRC